MKLKKTLLRAAAFVTLIAFGSESLFAQNLSLSAQALTPSEVHFLQEKNWLPAELGKVDEVYGTQPSIFLIQDPHGQVQAQKNMEKLLELLQQKTGFKTLLIEGGIGKQDPSLLDWFQDPQWNQKAAEVLLREAQIGGPELFLQKHRSVQAFGLEDLAPYLKNLELFQKVIAHKSETGKWINDGFLRLKTQASVQMNAALHGFFKEWLTFEQAQSTHAVFLSQLEKNAKEILKINLHDPREQLSWPMMVRYFELRRRESLLNPKQAEQERVRLEAWGAEQGVEIPSDSQDLRTTWESFYEQASSKGFDFKDYPALALLEGFKILQQEIDAVLFLKEMEQLRDRVLEALIQNKEKENQIIVEAKKLLLLKKLFNLELTPDDFEQLQSVPPNLEKESSSLQAILQDALAFYQTAHVRDQVMARHLIEKSKNLRKPLVVIAGGFHTPGLTSFLKQADHAYAVLSPHLSEIEENGKYTAAMMGQKSILDLSGFSVRLPNHFTPPAEWKDRLPSGVVEARRFLRKTMETAALKAGKKTRSPSSRSEMRRDFVDLAINKPLKIRFTHDDSGEPIEVLYLGMVEFGQTESSWAKSSHAGIVVISVPTTRVIKSWEEDFVEELDILEAKAQKAVEESMGALPEGWSVHAVPEAQELVVLGKNHDQIIEFQKIEGDQAETEIFEYPVVSGRSEAREKKPVKIKEEEVIGALLEKEDNKESELFPSDEVQEEILPRIPKDKKYEKIERYLNSVWYDLPKDLKGYYARFVDLARWMAEYLEGSQIGKGNVLLTTDRNFLLDFRLDQTHENSEKIEAALDLLEKILPSKPSQYFAFFNPQVENFFREFKKILVQNSSNRPAIRTQRRDAIEDLIKTTTQEFKILREQKRRTEKNSQRSEARRFHEDLVDTFPRELPINLLKADLEGIEAIKFAEGLNPLLARLKDLLPEHSFLNYVIPNLTVEFLIILGSVPPWMAGVHVIIAFFVNKIPAKNLNRNLWDYNQLVQYQQKLSLEKFPGQEKIDLNSIRFKIIELLWKLLSHTDKEIRQLSYRLLQSLPPPDRSSTHPVAKTLAYYQDRLVRQGILGDYGEDPGNFSKRSESRPSGESMENEIAGDLQDLEHKVQNYQTRFGEMEEVRFILTSGEIFVVPFADLGPDPVLWIQSFEAFLDRSRISHKALDEETAWPWSIQMWRHFDGKEERFKNIFTIALDVEIAPQPSKEVFDAVRTLLKFFPKASKEAELLTELVKTLKERRVISRYLKDKLSTVIFLNQEIYLERLIQERDALEMFPFYFDKKDKPIQILLQAFSTLEDFLARSEMRNLRGMDSRGMVEMEEPIHADKLTQLLYERLGGKTPLGKQDLLEFAGQPFAFTWDENYKGLSRFFKLGPLFFLTVNERDAQKLEVKINQKKEQLEEVYQAYPGNIFFFTPSDYGSTPQLPMNLHAFLTILAMLRHQDSFKNKKVMVLGAGDGLLARVALSLGAQQVLLIEKEKDLLQRARVYLNSQGWIQGTDYLMYSGDFTQGDWPEALSEWAQEAEVGILNMGPWPDLYKGDSNFEGMALASAFPRMGFLINTGYGYDPKDSAFSALHKNEMNRVFNLLTEKGFLFQEYQLEIGKGVIAKSFIATHPRFEPAFASAGARSEARQTKKKLEKKNQKTRILVDQYTRWVPERYRGVVRDFLYSWLNMWIQRGQKEAPGKEEVYRATLRNERNKKGQLRTEFTSKIKKANVRTSASEPSENQPLSLMPSFKEEARKKHEERLALFEKELEKEIGILMGSAIFRIRNQEAIHFNQEILVPFKQKMKLRIQDLEKEYSLTFQEKKEFEALRELFSEKLLKKLMEAVPLEKQKRELEEQTRLEKEKQQRKEEARQQNELRRIREEEAKRKADEEKSVDFTRIVKHLKKNLQMRQASLRPEKLRNDASIRSYLQQLEKSDLNESTKQAHRDSFNQWLENFHGELVASRQKVQNAAYPSAQEEREKKWLNEQGDVIVNETLAKKIRRQALRKMIGYYRSKNDVTTWQDIIMAWSEFYPEDKASLLADFEKYQNSSESENRSEMRRKIVEEKKLTIEDLWKNDKARSLLRRIWDVLKGAFKLVIPQMEFSYRFLRLIFLEPKLNVPAKLLEGASWEDAFPLSERKMRESIYPAQTKDKLPFVLNTDLSKGDLVATIDRNPQTGEPYYFLDMNHFAARTLSWGHPEVILALLRNSFELNTKIAYSDFATPVYQAYIKLMRRMSPEELNHIFLVNSGAEAVENAVKAAKIKRPASKFMIAFKGSFHGRTAAAASLTSKAIVRQGSLFPWPFADYPDRQEKQSERELGLSEEKSLQHIWQMIIFGKLDTVPLGKDPVFEKLLSDMDDLLKRFNQNSERNLDALDGLKKKWLTPESILSAKDVMGVILEPYQAEGGVRLSTARFHQRLRLLTYLYGIPLIYDEVQSGMHLTGTPWAHEQFNLPVPPDFVTFGKKAGMGGIYYQETYKPGDLNSTWGGDGAGMVRAPIHQKIISRDHLIERIPVINAYVLQRLQNIKKELDQKTRPDFVRYPHGWGMAFAINFESAVIRDEVLERALRHGLILNAAGTPSENIFSIRILPAYDSPLPNIEQALTILQQSIEEVYQASVRSETRTEIETTENPVAIEFLEKAKIPSAIYLTLKTVVGGAENYRIVMLELSPDTEKGLARRPFSIENRPITYEISISNQLKTAGTTQFTRVEKMYFEAFFDSTQGLKNFQLLDLKTERDSLRDSLRQSLEEWFKKGMEKGNQIHWNSDEPALSNQAYFKDVRFYLERQLKNHSHYPLSEELADWSKRIFHLQFIIHREILKSSPLMQLSRKLISEEGVIPAFEQDLFRRAHQELLSARSEVRIAEGVRTGPADLHFNQGIWRNRIEVLRKSLGPVETELRELLEDLKRYPDERENPGLGLLIRETEEQKTARDKLINLLQQTAANLESEHFFSQTIDENLEKLIQRLSSIDFKFIQAPGSRGQYLKELKGAIDLLTLRLNEFYFFQLLEILNRHWWFLQGKYALNGSGPREYHDKMALSFNQDHPSLQMIVSWDETQFEAKKHQLLGMIQDRIRMGKLASLKENAPDFARFEMLTRKLNLVWSENNRSETREILQSFLENFESNDEVIVILDPDPAQVKGLKIKEFLKELSKESNISLKNAIVIGPSIGSVAPRLAKLKKKAGLLLSFSPVRGINARLAIHTALDKKFGSSRLANVFPKKLPRLFLSENRALDLDGFKEQLSSLIEAIHSSKVQQTEKFESNGQMAAAHRSELRVAEITAEILRVGSRLFNQMFPTAFAAEDLETLSLAAKEEMMNHYSALLKKGSKVVLPAALFKEAGIESILSLILTAAGRVPSAGKVIYIAGDHGNEIKNKVYSKAFSAAYPELLKSASRVMEFSPLEEVQVAKGIKNDSTAISFDKAPATDLNALPLPSFLWDLDAMKKLNSVQKSQYTHRLIQLQFLMADELSHQPGDRIPLVKNFLRTLGIEFNPGNFPQPSIESVLSDAVGQALAQKLTSQSA